jgi:hypothetical protein
MDHRSIYPRFSGASWLREAARIMAIAAGGLLTLVGVMIAVTPLPFGAFLMATGLVTLISASPTVARVVRDLRTRFAPIDRTLSFAERFSPSCLARVLHSTLPERPRLIAATVRA